LIARRYDGMFRSFHHESFFGGSGYSNFGLWDDGVGNGKAASDNLVRELVAFGRTLEPVAPARVLDVACGAGGTTAWLAAALPDAAITGINLSEAQLAAARRRVPRAAFRYMDAARLELADGAFDWVVCVEAAFHFDTRRRFLAEAARVLRPGGLLLVTDLVTHRGRLNAWRARLGLPMSVPMTNEVTDREAYRSLVEDAGFARVELRSERARTLVPFGKRFLASCVRNAATPRTWPALARDPVSVPTFALWYAYNRLRIADYLLIVARR
jgi:SAM-dependent methyltransferase